MDPTWTALLSGATGAAVVGYLARLLLERALRSVDELRAENRRLAADLVLMDKRIEGYQANLDKRLELGNQKFDHHKMTTDDILRRVRDLELDSRASSPTRIIDTRSP
jgi:glycosyltransferase A (GT-A) superfamily protein (DUF2064 family)